MLVLLSKTLGRHLGIPDGTRIPSCPSTLFAYVGFAVCSEGYDRGFKKTESYHPSPPALANQFNIKPDPMSMGMNGPIQVAELGFLPLAVSLPPLLIHLFTADWLCHLVTPTLEALGIPEQLSPLSGNNIGV